MTTQNYIIGAAIGYSEDKTRIFLQSLADVKFDGKIVLFIGKDQTSHQSFGLNVDWRLIPHFDQQLQSMSPTAQRFFVFRHYLLRERIVGNILISDVRDVLFQSNPFTDVQFERFSLFYALEERIIGNCRSNANWIIARYGQGVLRQLLGHTISCCGTLMGTSTGIGSYLDRMCQHLAGSPSIFGIDQGVHNYIIYLDALPNQTFLLNGLSPIMTMHYMNKENLRFNQHGKILNYNGSVPAIVHQYDRLDISVQQRFSALSRDTINPH